MHTWQDSLPSVTAIEVEQYELLDFNHWKAFGRRGLFCDRAWCVLPMVDRSNCVTARVLGITLAWEARPHHFNYGTLAWFSDHVRPVLSS